MGMSSELIGILSVGVAIVVSILMAALWIGGWLRNLETRLARVEGLIEGAAMFRTGGAPAADHP